MLFLVVCMEFSIQASGEKCELLFIESRGRNSQEFTDAVQLKLSCKNFDKKAIRPLSFFC